MTDSTHTPLPEQHDGEPDFAAEIARLDSDLKTLSEATRQLENATDYETLTSRLDALLNDETKATLPKDGSKLDQVFARITAALDAQKKAPVIVPETDRSKPALTPVAPDLSTLPAHARMAHGYR
jgi:hypothetical protein